MFNLVFHNAFISKFMDNSRPIACKYFIDDDYYEIIYNATIADGKDIIQYNIDFDLLGKSKFKDEGYCVAPFLMKNEFDILVDYVTKKIKDVLTTLNIQTDKFALQNYHNFVSDQNHIDVINKIVSIKGEKLVGIDIDEIPIDIELIENKVSDLLDYKMSFDETSVFYIRLVRPNSHDNNPPHRDSNLDRLRNLINLYIPIAGSNNKSSLSLAPKSHFFSDKDFYIIKNADVVSSNINSNGYNTRFTVPSNVPKKILKMTRPNPALNEFLIFTPYLIHGGAANKSNETRVSIEMRLHRK